MKTTPEILAILARLNKKGKVTIVETPGHVNIALVADDQVITVSNKNVIKLLLELEEMIENWPEK